MRANNAEVGRIGPGMVMFMAARVGDGEAEVDALARKAAALRIFDDAQGRMNASVRDTGGGVLVISQFTLYGDTRHGNRPGWSLAAKGPEAEPLYERMIARLREHLGADRVQSGCFGAEMEIGMVHDGPVSVELTREGDGVPLRAF
ncbi:MAG: D-aminoacyl-tRNA deacylase [Kiritimatiellaeota bacterium]|nr:D-aminoacyl-tRNA deacylase [Kiritimatiellota bacterium]